MMIDHETRLTMGREHAAHLRQTMLATKRRRRESDVKDTPQPPTAQVYVFPKAEAQTQRGAAA